MTDDVTPRCSSLRKESLSVKRLATHAFLSMLAVAFMAAGLLGVGACVAGAAWSMRAWWPKWGRFTYAVWSGVTFTALVSMGEGGLGKHLDIIRDDEFPTLNGCPRSGQFEQSQGPARADSHDHVGVMACGCNQIDYIALQVRVDIYILHAGLHGTEDFLGNHSLQDNLILLTLGPSL